MIEAIILDFDGLILETEGPVYQSWKEVYEAYHCRMNDEEWVNMIGADPNQFDPFTSLEVQLGHSVDRAKVEARRAQRELEIVHNQPIMPGVIDTLDDAQRLGLKVGLASSSDYTWVGGHLTRLGLIDRFNVIRTNDDVKKGKPDPDLFLSALQGLGTLPERAIAFEDSYNGILSAQRAGIFCIAVPTEMTRRLPLDRADMRIDSLASLPLKDLIDEVERIKAKSNHLFARDY
jgi:HAD superfamily hydrolase (TIGR01509 family)